MYELEAFREQLRTQRPVDWDHLPDFALYMDQVLSYMDRQVIRYRETREQNHGNATGLRTQRLHRMSAAAGGPLPRNTPAAGRTNLQLRPDSPPTAGSTT